MKKIPTIFQRDFHGDPSKVLSDPNPDCDWVFTGEGIATRKMDGTCCKFDGSQWWKRREVKQGKADPDEFVLEDSDANTGKRVGWVPVSEGDKWHLEGISNSKVRSPGTFELCGPKVQGNPEGFDIHVMVLHGAYVLDGVPRDFHGLSEWTKTTEYEGVVFHHPDGQMAKIKRRDFGE